MLDKLFLQILNMSFTASVVLLAVIAARLLLKKSPRVISYVLWAVVLFVEKVSGDGNTIYFSEANWYNDSRLSNGKWEPDPSGTDGASKSLTVAKFKERTGGSSFQGFIYLV